MGRRPWSDGTAAWHSPAPRAPSAHGALTCSAPQETAEGKGVVQKSQRLRPGSGQAAARCVLAPAVGRGACHVCCSWPPLPRCCCSRMGAKDCLRTGPGHRDNTKASRRLVRKVRGESPASRRAGPLAEMGMDSHRTGSPLKLAPADARDQGLRTMTSTLLSRWCSFLLL